MQSFFYGLARQSLTAGWMILALLLLRPLLKKAPRAVSCLLWGLAAVRLVFPFSLESRVSLVPQQIAAPVRVTPIDPTYFAGPTIQTGAPAAAQVVSRGISWREVVPWVWLIGVAVMGIYALVSYLRLARRVRASVRIKDRLYICDNVSSPFILGLFRPKIYLPSDLVQPATDYVLAHERAHLRRGDHLWKPLGYALLTVYWFNPLCWLAYILFCRDMEQACDEAVIKNMTQKDKKAYSAALLQCSMPRSAIAACPVAFGEVSVKQRIRGVLNYRRPTLWVVAASAVLCMVLAACFLTDPVEANQAEAEATESAELQEYPLYSSPSEGSRTVYQLLPGEDYTIIRTEPIGDQLWAYVECQDGKTHGWMILGTEEAAFAKTSEAAIETPKPDGDYITYPREVIVYSAPDHDSWELARYPAGMPVSLDGMEVEEGSIWGYVKYLDGETLGWISLDEIMDAFINRQSSFSLRTTIYSSPSRQARQIGQGEIGDVYLLQSMEPFGENIWGYIEYQKENTTIMGWILLNEGKAPLSDLYEVPVYASPSEDGRILCELAFGEDFTILERETIENTIWAYVECKEGTTRGWVRLVQGSESEIFLSGTVTAETLNVRSGPGTMNSAVGVLEAGTKVIILEVVSEGNQQWGRIGSNAWVNMAYIDCGGEASATATLSDPIEATFPNALEPTLYNGKGEQHSFTRQTTIYSSPSPGAREILRAEAGETYYLIRREPIAGSVWDYVECDDGAVMGWILLEESEEQPQEIPVYRNPDVDSVIVCTLAHDEDYTILETQPIDNHIWGEVECQDGKTRGWIILTTTLDTVITGTVSGPDNVNVRSGPGVSYSTLGYLEAGTEVSIFEIVTSDNLEWGRISGSGWVCMRYIEYGVTASGDSDITYYNGPKESTESYTFSQETNVYSSPGQQARVVAQAAAGEECTITRREFIADGSWGYVQLQGGSIMGWVHFVEEDEALNYFRGYVEACNQPGPDEAEQYLYFTSEYAREFFRDNYAPVTGWYPSGIFRVNENLWGIQYADSNSDRMVYSFVGRIDDRLYVFQNVHQVPEELSENLDVAAYEEENAMYLSDEYMECYSVIKQLLPFADPTYVTVEDKGSKDYSTASPCPIEDVICGTDTWRVVPEPRSYGSPSCIITLTARDGSVATICDSSPVILVTDADGTQQWFQGWASGEELVGMLYSWAKSIEWTPGE